MIRPTTSVRSAPAPAPILLVFGAGTSPFEILTTFGIMDDNTKGCAGAMLNLMATTSQVGNNPLHANCGKAFSAGVAASWVTAFNAAVADVGSADHTAALSVESNSLSAAGWMIDLINANKKSKITRENVDGYFQSLGCSKIKAGGIAKFIHAISDYFPDEVSDQGFRDLLTPGKWTDYRLTRVSSGKIMVDYLPVLRELGFEARYPGMDAAIRASATAPWDISLADLIPSQCKAFVSIYTDDIGKGIDDWYQGEKATSELPADKMLVYRATSKKYIEFCKDTSTITAAPNKAALAIAVAGLV